MARHTSREKAGFYAFPDQHTEALLSLVAPATSQHKLLDPMAGEGAIAEAMGNAWKLTVYTNELDKTRARACVSRFGAHAIQGDVETLEASNNAFAVLWANPPYDVDKTEDGDSKRVEYKLLRHSWKWLQDGGLGFWVVYHHHLTDAAAHFFAENCSHVDVWALPGKHLDVYDQIIVVGVKGRYYDSDKLFADIQAKRAAPRPLVVQEKPVYRLPSPASVRHFSIAPRTIDEETGARYIADQGAWKNPAFQELLSTPTHEARVIESVLPPRPGHTTIVLAAGFADGAVIQSEEYGAVAIRGKTVTVEKEKVTLESNGDPEHPTVHITKRLTPTSTIAVLSATGDVVQFNDDSAMIKFISDHRQQLTQYIAERFNPIYQFDLNGMHPFLDSIRLNGKYALYNAQKHVVAATVKGFEQRDGILLVGQMGTGKAQPLTAKVLTPTGWTLMGNLRVGDAVINPSGGTAHVIGVFPQGVKEIYRVTFSDGSSTECCREHLWQVIHPNQKWIGHTTQVKTLDRIMNSALSINGNHQHFIPMVEPVQYTAQPLPLDAYALGVLIGDGSPNGRSVLFSTAAPEIVSAMQSAFPTCTIKHESRYDYTIHSGRPRNDNGTYGKSPLNIILESLNLKRKLAHNKQIPPSYLYAALPERIALLQGLLDTDGSVANANGIGIEYVTISSRLAADVQELVWSLGGKANISTKIPTYRYKGEHRTGQLAYRLYISLPPGIKPFRLSRKARLYQEPTKYKPTRAIADIKAVGFKQAQCIALDSANQLYVTDDYIVTHNTAMGSGAAVALGSGIARAMRGKMRSDQVVLIICPPHLARKWEREARSISPRTYIEHIKRHEDVKAFMDKAARLGSGIAKIGIIKRDMTKLGSGRESAVIWRKYRKTRWEHNEPRPPNYPEAITRIFTDVVPTCPNCGQIVTEGPDDARKPMSKHALNSRKRACDFCRAPLWQEKRDASSEPRPGEKYPRANPRYRIDEYIKRKYPDRVALLIWDEVHEAQHGDTGNGEAFGRMANFADKVLAMTGTPFNGRASSLFNLEYHLNPRVRRKYAWGGAPRFSRKRRQHHIGSTRMASWHSFSMNIDLGYPEVHPHNAQQRGDAESRWVDDMGVREGGEDDVPQYDKETGEYTGTTNYVRPYVEAPGISPLCVAEVLDHTIFFSLTDMSDALPEYREDVVMVDLDDDMLEAHNKTEQKLKDHLLDMLLNCSDNTFRGAYFHWCIDWINSAFLSYDVIHNFRDKGTRAIQPNEVCKLASMGVDRLYAEEEKLLEIVDAELDANRPCIVFCRQTNKRDIQGRLKQLIEARTPLAKAFILESKVDPDRREAVIEQAVQSGHNIIIANPELVKTGLDLVFAGTLIFFEPIYNLGTMMQAAGRNYRLNQKLHKLCRVIYLVYNGTMEAKAIQLMSKKQRAAKILLGDTGLTGLEALTEGEGGLQEALLSQVGESTELVDPATLFKVYDETRIIDCDDLSFWNVAITAAAAPPEPDLLETAAALGATITPLPKSEPDSPYLLPDGFQPRNTTAPEAPLTIVPKRATAIRDLVRSALAPCLPTGATTEQQLDHDTHITDVSTLIEHFIAETPIFWEDGSEQLLALDIRKHLLYNRIAPLATAVQVASTLLTALKPAALDDAKTRVQHKRTPTRTKPQKASLDAPLPPAVERFQQRVPTHPPEVIETFTQLSMFG